MSSQYKEDRTQRFMAAKAVDGVYLPSQWHSSIERNSIAHSEQEARPWWRVDLAATYCVWAVNILNRAG